MVAGLPRPSTRTSIQARPAARERPPARLRGRHDKEGDAAPQEEEHCAAFGHQEDGQPVGKHLRVGRSWLNDMSYMRRIRQLNVLSGLVSRARYRTIRREFLIAGREARNYMV